jgi:phosphate transport system permease protein
MPLLPRRSTQAAADAQSASLASGTISRRRLLADKTARWAVIGGGMAIIAAILGILLFILVEIWPLLGGAQVTSGPVVAVEALDPGALVTDEYRSRAVTLGRDGQVRVVDLEEGSLLEERPLLPGEDDAPRLAEILSLPAADAVGGLLADGRVALQPVTFRLRFDEQARRRVDVELEEPIVLPTGAAGRGAANLSRDRRIATAAVQHDDGTIEVVRQISSENAFTGETTVEIERESLGPVAPLSALMVNKAGNRVFGGTPDGRVLLWERGRPQPLESSTGSGVTALGLLLGDRSLLVGRADGAIEVFFSLGGNRRELRLERVRAFVPHEAPITAFSPSLRNKGFLALDAAGGAGLYYSTSERTLWEGRAPIEDPGALYFAPRADAALFGGEDRIGALVIENPHPEVSLKALFGKVWYESYDEPQMVWQSSSATDDFEPKLSLTPLLVGTLKGTFYSLILAIPLGVFGAMYASQFMHPTLRQYVKPTVEIMAALPSVVLGFLAGLWLAPRIELYFPALLLMVVLLPLLTLLAGYLWNVLPRRWRGRVPTGGEIVVFGVFIALGIWVSIELAGPFETLAFGGSFPGWLHEATGVPYDQRNAIVVGLAMGFAVIPIIFSVAEDAFSNVPGSLVSGSLALGASRWQTVTQIVLPTASPGIFSAIMIGFGRAVGETMIVLMATGNTPIMDWNPFNGFRTLSANIAVEIPEAPHGGTLYRTLFLAALLLFILTFVINTAAELVRQGLRRRYANL